MDIAAELAAADPAALFGEREAQAGAAYLAEGRILYAQVAGRDDDRWTARGFAHGSGRQTYSVSMEARLRSGRLSVATTCSCPVHAQCKHGAGLFLAVRPAPEPVARGWREELEDLAAAVAPAARPEPRAVGLEVAWEAAPYGAGERRLTLRPMRPGARQGWVRTGLGWGDLPRAAASGQYVPAQLAAVERLRAALITGGRQWHATRFNPTLRDFGPEVVRLLREARDVGVTLLAAEPLPPVVVLDEPAALGVDVTRGEGDAQVRVGLTHEGGFWAGEQVLLVGDPAHSAGLRDGGRLALVALARPLQGAALSAVLRDAPLTVPAAEVDQLTDRLGALTRALPVVSTDGSVEVPESPAPRLELTVRWHDAVRAEIAWDWRYASLGTVPLGAPATPRLLRDPEAEEVVVAQLDPPPGASRQELVGSEALTLALVSLPAWRAAGVEVVEHDAPTFRESTEAPQISLAVRDELQTEPGDEHRPDHTDWLDLEVMITVEGHRIPLAHVVEALTRGHTRLVLPGGLWLSLERPELARLAEVVREAAELRPAPDGAVRVGTRDLGLWAELADLGAIDAAAAQFVRRALALRDLTEVPRPEPTGVTTELRGYQREGFWWLALLWEHGLGGVLADDMGLGKTLQVLALIAHARARDAGPFLVVAPTSVVPGWVEQAARHTPGLRVVGIDSGRRGGPGLAELAREADVVVTSYTLLRLDAAAYHALEWGGLVLDEAQQVKNHRSQAHAAVRGVRAPFALAVTGTPFENRLMELWSLLSIVAPGLYPRPRAFQESVVRPVERNGDAAALARLTRRIKPFVLRRTKERVAADLPPKQVQVLPVELSARHRRVYDTHLNRERQRILGLVTDDFDRNRVAILAALTRLRQLALDPALVDEDHAEVGSEKVEVLVEHLRELAAEGHRALVFSQFTSFLRRVRERLEAEGLGYAYLDGSTQRRGEVVERFRAGDAPVFLISLKAGGTGLTLTEADYVFVLDPWWNPAVEAQAIDRSHRIGQQRAVHVYRLVATGTIEEKVLALQERKAQLFAQVVDGEGALSEAITADDVRGLLG
ncbi:DEAD/DEAH box helicase [Nocardioides sp. TRM66260-LWL]|uniref:DEAD/DEAH box helicase n=1 Tax=Nocardioides sp. TRM66260-LWL TaxID=2874478 RepID=UPI001CC72074|nr:DEAD/DEAH box helicase [Nocardioides sp. TRM66260-LWL]MBZ5734249.1 DEAD/DEAH box helicase [Nocardioides sp. TRM66260-LWL]